MIAIWMRIMLGVLWLWAGAVQASTLTVEIVEGRWVNSKTALGADPSCESDACLRWGEPATDGGQSGYDFISAFSAPGKITTGSAFDVGSFSHINMPIYADSDYLLSTDLELSLRISGVVAPITTVFSFAHNETDNGAEICANPNADNSVGCADQVVATRNRALSESFELDGVSYIFDIVGFQVGGKLFDSFWTAENATNTATFVGQVREQGPAIVPLPTALLAALSGLGVLAGLRSIRRSGWV